MDTNTRIQMAKALDAEILDWYGPYSLWKSTHVYWIYHESTPVTFFTSLETISEHYNHLCETYAFNSPILASEMRPFTPIKA